jgi:hypothetical protein
VIWQGAAEPHAYFRAFAPVRFGEDRWQTFLLGFHPHAQSPMITTPNYK